MLTLLQEHALQLLLHLPGQDHVLQRVLGVLRCQQLSQFAARLYKRQCPCARTGGSRCSRLFNELSQLPCKF